MQRKQTSRQCSMDKEL